MSLQEIKDYIKSCYINEGYDESRITDEFIEEGLKEELCIYKEDVSEHRWYTAIEKIVKIGDKYFKFEDYYITGDTTAEDMGLEFNWDSLREVEPYEVVATKFRVI